MEANVGLGDSDSNLIRFHDIYKMSAQDDGSTGCKVNANGSEYFYKLLNDET